MKKLLFAVCLAIAVVMLVTPAFAEEEWDGHLRGLNEGLVAGALPPAGLYFVNNFYFTPSFNKYGVAGPNGTFNPSATNQNSKLFTYVDTPILFWSSGCKFLGADYGAAIAQPFDFTSLRINNGGFTHPGTFNSWTTGDQWGAFNTIITPAILAWTVCDFRIKGAVQIGLNDGTSSAGDSLAADPSSPLYHHGAGKLAGKDGSYYAWTSNDAYTVTPVLGLSWVHAGWNVSAEFFYTVFTKDTDTQYQNGDEFAADYTISYTWNGKWTLGLGAQQENQLFNDKFDAGNGKGYRSQPNTMNTNYTMGPIIGYNFGPCSLMFTYNFTLETKNEVGGDWFNLRLVIPLGNPLPVK